MLGFNFYPPSSRYIDPEACAEIVACLKSQIPGFIAVGVFVNETARQVQEIMATCHLDLAQLAGDESPQDLASLDGKGFKAGRPKSFSDADGLLQQYGRHQAPALLVDAHVKGAYGGTGETGDWALARYLAAQAPILLAGGLNPDNVAAAIQMVNPWGVDVASGVESSPGNKDSAKISAFISAVRSGVL